MRDAVQTAEHFIYDQRLVWSQRTGIEQHDDAEIVIIDIDERSLGAVGRWPWPRATMADLLEQLWAAGTIVVAFDIVFAEPERNPAERVARGVDDPALRERLGELAPRFDGDRHLAEQLARGDAVLGFFLHRDETATHTGTLPEPARGAEELGTGTPVIHRFQAYTGNRPALQEAATGAGAFSVIPDADGVVRRAPLLLGHGDAVYPGLALETARVYQLLDDFRVETVALGAHTAVDAIELGAARLPTDARGQALIPYRGPRGSFPYISAVDLLRGETDPDALEGAIALIGTSAMGLYDLRPTPTDAAFPGVEIHANLLAGILADDLPRKPAWVDGANLVTTLTAGLVAAGLLPFLGPLATLAVTAGLLALLVGGNLWAWAQWDLALGAAGPLAAVLLIGAGNLTWGFLFEHRRRHQLRQRFGEYVPPELVERMAEAPTAYTQTGETREITVLFADIRGFTTLSERLDAVALRELLNRFFTPMTRVIFEHGGTIDKYVGDLIMAFWGAPMDDPEHRRHAVAAALAMQREAERLREELAREGLPAIEIGIGLNSGPAAVGDMGSAYRRAYTALGDAVNLASRVEGQTKAYGVGLLVTEHTRAGLETVYGFREIDRIQVKGRSQPVTLYEPVEATQSPAET
nr:adenylate/guanylate cyclase domain-containing protein [Halorhodospira halophila]